MSHQSFLKWDQSIPSQDVTIWENQRFLRIGSLHLRDEILSRQRFPKWDEFLPCNLVLQLGQYFVLWRGALLPFQLLQEKEEEEAEELGCNIDPVPIALRLGAFTGSHNFHGGFSPWSVGGREVYTAGWLILPEGKGCCVWLVMRSFLPNFCGHRSHAPDGRLKILVLDPRGWLQSIQ